MFPFGYKPDYTDLGVTPTNLVKDFSEIRSTAVYVDFANVNKTFPRVSSIGWYTVNSGVLASSIYDLTESTQNANVSAKAQEMYNSVYNKYSGNSWNTIIQDYKTAVGIS
jgi:hypothetical protein